MKVFGGSSSVTFNLDVTRVSAEEATKRMRKYIVMKMSGNSGPLVINHNDGCTIIPADIASQCVFNVSTY